MTREDKILSLIKLVGENPYKYSLLKLRSRSFLTTSEIVPLIELLNLEVLGYCQKNKRRDIEKYIEYNPKCSAKEVQEAVDAPSVTVYDVGKKMEYRFSTDYSRRTERIRKKDEEFRTRKYRTYKIKNKIYANRIEKSEKRDQRFFR